MEFLRLKFEHMIDFVHTSINAKQIFKTNSFHPGDVIGQVVKASMGIIGNDGVAVEIQVI